MEERRLAERMKPAEDCIVVHSRKVGNINNISAGGLYCTCFQDSKCKKDTQREIDILCGQGQLLVRGLKVKVIDTVTMPGRFLTNFEVRNCRLQFIDMDEEHNFGIETILNGACVH